MATPQPDALQAYRQEHAHANGGRELCIQLGGKVAPASITSSKDPSFNDMGTDPDPSFQGGMRITFKDLTYTVKSHHDRRVQVSLLTSISGFLNPGQMSALMGPSGSGKTTLLDVLAGRKTAGRIEGRVLFAGVKPTTMFLRRYTGYVEQFDTLVDVLTVEEMLLYTAELKRPLGESTASKREAVLMLIEDLNLTGCKNTRIGNSMHRGISGGQCKRTNIGVALITNPRVLFLDEPTSGLDSYTCNELMTVVKRLVKSGIAICATVHSPTPYVFRLFDRILLLLRGRMVYFGDRGHEAIEYFGGLPLQAHGMQPAEPLQEGNNEAEWIVDLTTRADREGRAPVFAGMYEGSELKRANDAELDCALQQHSALRAETLAQLATVQATVTPFWWGLWILLRYRTAKNYMSTAYLGPRTLDKLIFSFLIFSLYFNLGKNFYEYNLNNIAAIMYMWATLPAFSATSYIPSIVLERPLFTRERNDGLYRVITYLCAKLLDELMLNMLGSVVFSIIVFYGVRLQGAWVVFWLVYLLTLSVGIALAYTVAAISPNMDIANSALPTYCIMLLFFEGFLIREPSMPVYWRPWAPIIDFMRYAWHALMTNEFEKYPNVLQAGLPVLEFYDITDSKWASIGYEFLFFLAFFFTAWLALSFCKHSAR